MAEIKVPTSISVIFLAANMITINPNNWILADKRYKFLLPNSLASIGTKKFANIGTIDIIVATVIESVLLPITTEK